MGFFHDNEQVEVRGWVANRMMSAYEAVQRVRALHKPYEWDNHIECVVCPDTEYPCETIKALGGETEYPKGPITRPDEEVIKKLEDEIFNEEEFLYKEHSDDTGYLNGLRYALKIVKEGKENARKN